MFRTHGPDFQPPAVERPESVDSDETAVSRRVDAGRPETRWESMRRRFGKWAVIGAAAAVVAPATTLAGAHGVRVLQAAHEANTAINVGQKAPVPASPIGSEVIACLAWSEHNDIYFWIKAKDNKTYAVADASGHHPTHDQAMTSEITIREDPVKPVVTVKEHGDDINITVNRANAQQQVSMIPSDKGCSETAEPKTKPVTGISAPYAASNIIDEKTADKVNSYVYFATEKDQVKLTPKNEEYIGRAIGQANHATLTYIDKNEHNNGCASKIDKLTDGAYKAKLEEWANSNGYRDSEINFKLTGKYPDLAAVYADNIRDKSWLKSDLMNYYDPKLTDKNGKKIAALAQISVSCTVAGDKQ